MPLVHPSEAQTETSAILDATVGSLQQIALALMSDEQVHDLALVSSAVEHLDAATLLLQRAALLLRNNLVGQPLSPAIAADTAPPQQSPQPRPSAAFTMSSDDRAAILTVTGDCRLSDVPELLRVVRKALETGPPLLVIDMAAVTRLDAVVAATLVHLHVEGVARGHNVVVCGVHGQPGDLLRRTGLGEQLDVRPSVDVALGRGDAISLTASWQLPFEERSARRARMHVRDTCLEWKIPTPTMNAAIDVASELVANAITHGDAPVRLTLELTAEALRVVVHDRSTKRAHLARYRPGVSETGLGLRLVERLTSQWGQTTDADGKSVWGAVGRGRSAAAGATGTSYVSTGTHR